MPHLHIDYCFEFLILFLYGYECFFALRFVANKEHFIYFGDYEGVSQFWDETNISFLAVKSHSP